MTEDWFRKMINPYMLQNYKTGLWTKDELQRLISAVSVHGTNNWKFISLIVGTRNDKQWQTKWKSLEGTKNQQSVPWSPLEERHLFELIFSNAYILLERNSGLQLKKERKAVAKKIKEMKEFWENAYFNCPKEGIILTNPPTSIQMQHQFYNRKDLPQLNNRALKFNKEIHNQMMSDNDIQIIDAEEAYSQNQPRENLNMPYKGREESKIQRVEQKRNKDTFMIDWMWTDGRVQWSTTENIKLIHQYQVFGDSWSEIAKCFWDKRVFDIKNHFYGMLYLTASEYQSEMTLSLSSMKSNSIDKWILGYTDGVKDSLYISDINNVSEEKLLWFLPILINIFTKTSNQIISKEIQQKESIEYRPLNFEIGQKNNSDEENTISYLRSLMMCPKQSFINDQKKLSFQIDLTWDEDPNEMNSKSKKYESTNNEEIILHINKSWDNPQSVVLDGQNIWNEEMKMQNIVSDLENAGCSINGDVNMEEQICQNEVYWSQTEDENDKNKNIEGESNSIESKMESDLITAVDPKTSLISWNKNIDRTDLINTNKNETLKDSSNHILKNIYDEDSDINLIISKSSKNAWDDQENLFSSIITYESMGMNSFVQQCNPPQITSKATLQNLSKEENTEEISNAEEPKVSNQQESMFKDFLFWLNPNYQKSDWDKVEVPNLIESKLIFSY